MPEDEEEIHVSEPMRRLLNNAIHPDFRRWQPRERLRSGRASNLVSPLWSVLGGIDNVYRLEEMTRKVDELAESEGLDEKTTKLLKLAFQRHGMVDYRVRTYPDEVKCEVYVNEVMVVCFYSRDGRDPFDVSKQFLSILTRKLFDTELEHIQ